MGQTSGTPAYMAPEQVEGRLDLIDGRTDVYGLGAILFEILVGRPPHEGRDTADVLARIVRGPTPRVRQLDATLPKVVDAICSRAMALRREDRYAEVAQLTADVERYLADEPVSAYAEPWFAQVARWLRRHRTFALMAAAMLVMATTISSVAFVLVRDQKEIAVAALERETRERRRAETELVLAQNAVDQIMGRVSNERLAPLPRNEPIRREMLAVALKFCQGLMVQNPRDPGVRWRTGRAHRQVGGIFQILGRFAEAEEQYAQSIELLSGLVAEDSRSDDYQRDLAAAHVDHGSLLEREGRPKLAEEAFRQARAMCDTLAEQHPDDVDFLVQRAVTDNNLGLLLLATGRPKDAADAHHRALQTYESLARKWPDALDYQQSVATSYNNLGAVLRTVGAFTPAEKAFGHALEIFERLHQKVPDKVDYRLAMAMAAANRAVVLSSLERRDDAEKSYQAAKGEFEKLTAEYPTVDDFRYKLAATLSNHVPSLALAGRPQDALATCERALDLYDQKAVGEDHVPPPADERAATLYRLGLLRMDAGQLDRAEPALQQSVEVWRKVIQEHPDQPGLLDQFASAAQALAQVVIQRADFAAARPLVEQALAAEQKAIALIAQPHYQRRERDLYVLLGQTLMVLHEFTRSAKALDASSHVLPDDGAGERRAAELLAQCIGFAQARKAADFDAERWAARSIALLRAAKEHGALDRAALKAKVFDPLRKRAEFKELER
jgi:serine/threonine-protein kinase